LLGHVWNTSHFFGFGLNIQLTLLVTGTATGLPAGASLLTNFLIFRMY